MLKSDNPNDEKVEDNKEKLAGNISEGEAGDNNDKVLKKIEVLSQKKV
jgi:hypothetical protein